MYYKRIFLVVIVFLLLAYPVGYFFDYRFNKRWDVLFTTKAANLLNEKNKFDIAFFGNSRINLGINPFIIDSMLHTRSYNFAVGASRMAFIKMQVMAYLSAQAPPKLICIGTEDDILNAGNAKDNFYPYFFYAGNDTISRHMKKVGYPMNLINVFPFLKYSFMSEFYRTSLFINGKPLPRFDHNIFNGFINIHEGSQPQLPAIAQPDELLKISSQSVADLVDIIHVCAARKIPLVFIYPPQNPAFLKAEKNSALSFQIGILKSFYRELSAKYKIPFFDFQYDAAVPQDYFEDRVHISNEGAKIFGKQVADSLRFLLK